MWEDTTCSITGVKRCVAATRRVSEREREPLCKLLPTQAQKNEIFSL